MSHRTLAVIAVAGVLGASTIARANSHDNPLDPGFYQGKPTRMVEGSASQPYVDTHDPDTPTYYVGKPSVTYEGTASHDSRPYRDVHNPLDPAYQPPNRAE